MTDVPSAPLRVFVAGATGVVGRRAVERLVAAGHHVTGIARTPERAELLRSLGAAPVEVSLFDTGALAEAMAGHDAAVNLATHIPPMRRAALPGAWAENDRIRTDGATAIVEAALAAGVGIVVQESIAFLYADAGDRWVEAGDPLLDSPYTAAVGVAEAQAARITATGGRGIVLRFGVFHAAEADHTRDAVRAAASGIATVLGAAEGYYPIVHADDAAAAVVAALSAPAGIYDVVVDEPPTRQDYADALGVAMGSPRPLRLPPSLAAKAGGAKTAALASSQQVSNRRFREATGWVPEFPDATAVLAEVVRSSSPADRELRAPLAARALLAAVAVSALQIGVWATLWPRSFTTSFPGFGRTWVAPDGPFNEHLVRDVGGLQLGLALVLVVAVRDGHRLLVRLASGAALAFGVPHLVYHATHLDPFGSGDAVAIVVSLTLAVAAPAAALAMARTPRAPDARRIDPRPADRPSAPAPSASPA